MLRGGKRGNLDKNGAVDIVKIFLNPGKTGDTEMDAEVERRVTLVSESAHQRVVFNHRDIQLTTFAPGGESSFQQKHKANRMHRLQSCTPAPCASPIRLKACCTIAKFCTNHGRTIEKSKSRWPSESDTFYTYFILYDDLIRILSRCLFNGSPMCFVQGRKHCEKNEY